MQKSEEVKSKIQELVNKYRDHKGLNPNEANVRKDFIDPLFEVLGWDIRDSREYNHETYVRGKEKDGRVDISIWVQHPLFEEPTAKIFVEVKKFGVIKPKTEDEILKYSEGESQVLEYSVNKKTKWAVLTNFETFRVFNAFTGLIILTIEKPEEYLEKLEDLLHLSKESIVSGRIQFLNSRAHAKFGIAETIRKSANRKLELANRKLELEQEEKRLKEEIKRFQAGAPLLAPLLIREETPTYPVTQTIYRYTTPEKETRTAQGLEYTIDYELKRTIIANNLLPFPERWYELSPAGKINQYGYDTPTAFCFAVTHLRKYTWEDLIEVYGIPDGYIKAWRQHCKELYNRA